MKNVCEIKNDDLAVYLGKTNTCLSCKIRLEELKVLEAKMPNCSFYTMDATDVEAIINEYKISKIPFFIVSRKGKVCSVFYSYKDLYELYYKIIKEERI